MVLKLGHFGMQIRTG